MSRTARYAGWAIALVIVAVLGWRIVATRVSDSLASSAPTEALAWDAHNPDALLALAQQQLADKHPDAAAATAGALLRAAPLQADALTVLARAALAHGDNATAARLFPLALRRAPRNQYARGWMIGNALQHGDYPAALHNIDVLFGFAPQHEAALIPLLVQVADHDPAFATALGQHLTTHRYWRSGLLDELLAHASDATVDAVFIAMQSGGTPLDDADAGRWLARLQKDGHWGEAYSLWVGRLKLPPGASLPAVYDGGFEQPATGIGFDWSMRGEPGVDIQRVPIASDDWVAQVTFRNRRADDMGFQQLLLLAPGRYTLTFRARAENLRSDQGMEWDIYCVAGGAPIAQSPRLEDSFDWKSVSVDFTVPATHCPAQRLQLVNPGAGGSGKVASGTLWFDDFKLTPIVIPLPSGAARHLPP